MDDEKDAFQVRNDCKENEDFVVVPDDAWNFLFDIYEGNHVPRYSIELTTEEDEGEEEDKPPRKKQYMIEIFLKKLMIYIFPKIKNHLCLKKPSAIFISRKATVLDFRKKIAEILHEYKKEG